MENRSELAQRDPLWIVNDQQHVQHEKQWQTYDQCDTLATHQALARKHKQLDRMILIERHIACSISDPLLLRLLQLMKRNDAHTVYEL
jgi:hypothetical protein